jgi:LmbE family N-acetylglucosaminyl deacetylase
MNVLAIAAHPDDETLGCAGTLLKHRDAGDALAWCIATRAFQPQWSAETIACKSREVESVAEQYCMSSVHWLENHTTRLDQVPFGDLIAQLRDVVLAVRPQVVYTVHGGDIHSDHRVLFEAVMSVIKPFNMAALGVKRLLSFETLSSTDAAPPRVRDAFIPAVFSDISPYMDRKLDIMACYASEIQPEPLPRSPSGIRAAARARGAAVGVEYAEAFQLVRELD